MFEMIDEFCRDGIVTFNDHDGMAAFGVAMQLHGGDVDAMTGQRGRHLGDMAGPVMMVVHDQRVFIP